MVWWRPSSARASMHPSSASSENSNAIGRHPSRLGIDEDASISAPQARRVLPQTFFSTRLPFIIPRIVFQNTRWGTLKPRRRDRTEGTDCPPSQSHLGFSRSRKPAILWYRHREGARVGGSAEFLSFPSSRKPYQSHRKRRADLVFWFREE